MTSFRLLPDPTDSRSFRASGLHDGVSFDIAGRPRAPAADLLNKRAVDMNGAFGNGSTTVSNSGDTIYSCNITLGGTEFEVLIDTGRCVQESSLRCCTSFEPQC